MWISQEEENGEAEWDSINGHHVNETENSSSLSWLKAFCFQHCCHVWNVWYFCYCSRFQDLVRGAADLHDSDIYCGFRYMFFQCVSHFPSHHYINWTLGKDRRHAYNQTEISLNFVPMLERFSLFSFYITFNCNCCFLNLILVTWRMWNTVDLYKMWLFLDERH